MRGTRKISRTSASPVTSGRPPYVLNLDPAVLECPYEANIDIRDTLSHKAVMQQYNLGPNGAIVTALNLYATRFHEVIGIIEQRRAEVSVLLGERWKALPAGAPPSPHSLTRIAPPAGPPQPCHGPGLT